MNDLRVSTPVCGTGDEWHPTELTDAQVVGLLSLSQVWASCSDTEEAGRARAALAVLERRKQDLALEIAAAREDAAREVHDDVQKLIAAFERARAQSVEQATEIAWSIAQVLVETSPGPSRTLQQQIVELMLRHPEASIRSSPGSKIHVDAHMNIRVIQDSSMPPDVLEVDLDEVRFLLGLSRLQQLIHSDVRAHIHSSRPRTVRRPAPAASWGDA
jgi:hypothetical protein